MLVKADDDDDQRTDEGRKIGIGIGIDWPSSTDVRRRPPRFGLGPRVHAFAMAKLYKL